MRIAFLAVTGSLLCSGWSQAQQVSTHTYICNIEGVQAQMVVQVQAVNGAGVFMDSGGGFGGAIGTGDVNYHYQGQLVSATGGRYVFNGTNQYADFVDLNTNERFRAQMIAQGANLVMVVNPQGPGPTQYYCQMTQ